MPQTRQGGIRSEGKRVKVGRCGPAAPILERKIHRKGAKVAKERGEEEVIGEVKEAVFYSILHPPSTISNLYKKNGRPRTSASGHEKFN
jgi:hypothetical protein